MSLSNRFSNIQKQQDPLICWQKTEKRSSYDCFPFILLVSIHNVLVKIEDESFDQGSLSYQDFSDVRNCFEKRYTH